MRTRFLLGITLTDLAALFLAMMIGSAIVFDTPWVWDARIDRTLPVLPLLAVMGAGAVVMSLATASMSGHGVPRPTYGRLVLIVAGTFFLTTTASFMVRDLPYSRRYVPTVLAIWAVLGAAHRLVRRSRPWTERFIVVSNEKSLIDDLAEAPHVELVGVIDPQTEGDLAPLPPGCGIAVDLRAVLSERVAQYVASCDLAGFDVRPLTSIYQEHLQRVPLVHLNEGWEISAPLVNTVPWLPGKRLVETLLVLVTAPAWLAVGGLVALWVRLASPGPVIFKQRRIGRGGQPFTMYKFRTMSPDAEEMGPRFAVEGDTRLIRGGAFLRGARLDEIPQLFNVLKGDMSLVGPRAEQVPFVRQFRKRIPFYDLRHLIRPGITGWAQVNFGYADDAADTIEKLSYDLYYIQHMSPILDLQILWKSIWTVLTGAGAR
jgi:lipopolysaccharide/colanic/teichoic acid biosynthesis glycosyltransferase